MSVNFTSNHSYPSNTTEAFSLHAQHRQGLTIWLGVMLTCGLSGGIINFFLAGMILSAPSLRSGSGLLIAHALITGGVMVFVSHPAFAIQTYVARYQSPTFRLCQGLAWQYFVIVQAAHWSETLVALNRFVAVVFPHSYKV
ncbi:hypothetical protein RvY_19118 [Ramazzottius varieornatus]|uniref:G-protein coupled receptors family 1 profile domain-containing protein n=1 Tax=Ramazzottius varieornatus TaxID=947166 RepID=A0A1D1W9M4_RAMVA|nr:hypothetical protein RvY_19118 [Ramazzottius varieornatus]